MYSEFTVFLAQILVVFVLYEYFYNTKEIYLNFLLENCTVL